MTSLRALTVVAGLVPSVALACPVCGQGVKEAQTALLIMTWILSLLPLGMLFGLGYFVYRRARKIDEQQAKLPPPAS